MKRSSAQKFLIYWLVRIFLGGLFIYAGAGKLSDPSSFSDAIASFSILPRHLVNFTALSLPAFEILMGLMLLVPLDSPLRIGAFGLILLNLLFIGVLASAWARGIRADCSCFGGSLPLPSHWKIPVAILRDILFLIAAVLLWMSRYQGSGVSRQPSQSEARI